MADQAQALKRAQVYLPFEAKLSKGPVTHGRQYVVTSFTLFDSREACDLCVRPHQAERQVKLTAEAREIRAGLSCLHQVSGITKTKMEKAVDGQVGLAVRVRRILSRGVGTPLSFETTQDTLQHLQTGAATLLEGHRHRDSILDEIDIVRQRLESQAITDADLRRLGLLTDHLAYLLEARAHPERHQARLQALRHDPHPLANRHIVRLARLSLDSPEELTPDDVRHIKDALRELAKLQMPGRYTPEIDPEEYASEAEYLEALEGHYQKLVKEGRSLRGTLQHQYDLVHFDNDRASLHLTDLLGAMTLPCVTPIYNHRALERLQPDSRAAQDWLSVRHGHRQVHLYASGRTHVQEVRTDKPQKRQDKNGKERRPRPEKRQDIPCWFAAFWIADPWHAVFPVWRAHGGRAELLTFPSSTA